MKMGGMGYKESSGLTPWASRARRAESSFGTPSPLHESLQFPVAEASEAANRNVGFTSTPAGSFAQIAFIAKRCGERIRSTDCVEKLAKLTGRENLDFSRRTSSAQVIVTMRPMGGATRGKIARAADPLPNFPSRPSMAV